MASLSGEAIESEETTEPEPEIESAVEEPVDDLSGDLTDADDIDALMASMSEEESEAQQESTSAAESLLDELPDSADIDELLASMSEPEVEQEETSPAENITEELIDSDDLDAFLNSLDSEEDVDIPSKEQNEPSNSASPEIDNIESENKKLIEQFTEEDVAPFLDYDFSEIQSSEDNTGNQTPESHPQPDLTDELDIEELIDNTEENNETEEELEVDGEIDLESVFNDVSSQVAEESKLHDVDAETLKAMESDFDEDALSHLLSESDNEESSEPIELTPDFSDSNVLSDLLSEEDIEDVVTNEVSELDDIQELDNLDFDELLLNIEEESSNSDTDSFGLSDDLDITDNTESNPTSDLDIGDDLIDDSINNIEDSNEEDFVTVDSLLSDSLEGNSGDEPYDKSSIEVGLDEFPEFSGEFDQEDDDSGMEAKLDLAKVYIEIDDKENAEIILMDVVAKGDIQQQLDAQQLLDNLG
jgi:pilus assembly protein FimV